MQRKKGFLFFVANCFIYFHFELVQLRQGGQLYVMPVSAAEGAADGAPATGRDDGNLLNINTKVHM